MPCLDISTNVKLDGINIDSVFAELTKVVAAIIGRPETFVMVLMRGSVALTFGGNKEPAAFAEIMSMGGIDSQVKKKLISSIGTILQNNLSIPSTRFVLKVYDTTMFRNKSKL
ncbi:decarboxylase [Lithospermum erythrorhizon]|uniref:Decarboxylase n=1 Tax=Lithospermum erythrorhizon TaxID=34254 RepID=A0AAV3RYN3_LITER